MDSKNKIVTSAQLKRKISRHRRQGLKIAFTNGCFDLLHYGHVKYLEAAKKNGRILILGLNSDSSVRKLKGPGRPLNPQMLRAGVLAALTCVDYVTIFNEETPYRLIGEIQPDILIKGADYKEEEIAGADIVRKKGGKVELIPLVKGCSTTRLIGMIQIKNCAKTHR